MGQALKTYLYGDDLISQSSAGQTHSFHYDGLGSTCLLSDNSGNVSDRYSYAAFGELLSESGDTDNSYLFTGEQYDDSVDNYYLRARYYNPSVGRFSEIDSWRGDFMEPITLNKYAYTNDDPVNFIDPSGRSAFLVQQSVAMSMITNFASISIRTGVFVKVAATTPIAYGLYQIEWDFKIILHLAEGKAETRNAEEEMQAQAEYDEIKDPCDNQPSHWSKSCSALSRQINFTKWCVKKFSRWDQRWLRGRHEEKIQHWENRIRNLKEEYNKKCT